ncbi:unnamed protein product [Pedinophyceae sp. YPF-701]|nr:unnamed protein product [Pedinophyceae sp. YPF-701]
MERGRRRNASVTAKAEEKLRAIEEARKAGKKAIDIGDEKEEDAVYDLLSEKEYAAYVRRKREEAGDFIVDDEGNGYADNGEEENWGFDGNAEDSPRAKGKGKGKGGKAGKGKAGNDAGGARERMQRMFMTAAAKPLKAPTKASKKAAESADALLDGILGEGDVDAAMPTPAPVHRVPGAFGSALRGVGAFATPGAGGAFRTPATLPRTAPLTAGRQEVGTAPLAPRKRAAARAASPATASKAARAGRTPPRSPLLAMSSRDQVPVAVGSSPLRRPAPAKRRALLADDDDDDEGNDTRNRGAPAADDDVVMDDGGGFQEEGGFGDGGDDAPLQDDAAPAAAKKPAAVADEDDEGDGTAQGWHDIFDGEGAAPAAGPAAAAAAPWVDDGTLPLDQSDQTLPFFLLDIIEEPSRPGTLFLMGKVAANAAAPSRGQGGTFVSACAVVENLQRSVLVVPKPDVFADASGELAQLEEAVAAEKAAAAKAGRAVDPAPQRELMTALHTRAADLKSELREILRGLDIEGYTLAPVKRRYAFEDSRVARTEQWCIKIRYAAAGPKIPMSVRGRKIAAMFGTNQSALEAVCLKRHLKGPCWIRLARPTRVQGPQQVSFCRIEVRVASAKCVVADEALAARPAPPLSTMAIKLQTHASGASGHAEIVAVSMVSHAGVSSETTTPRDQWTGPAARSTLRHLTVLSRCEGRPFPPGFEDAARALNAAGQGIVLSLQQSERSLLAFLLATLQQQDPDVLVGHNISGHDLSVLLHRLKDTKAHNWGRVGRLKRTRFPSLGGGGGVFGSGAGAGALAALAGRLLCDTYLAAKEFVKEIDYSLTTLAKNQLGQSRRDMDAAAVERAFVARDDLLALARHNEGDAWLSLGLAFHINVLPLSRQLAVLTGTLWNRVLQGQRALRIETLLAHEFHKRKFLLPDKLSARERDKLEKELAAIAARRAGGGGAQDDDEEMEGGEDGEDGAVDGGEDGDGAEPKSAKKKSPGGKQQGKAGATSSRKRRAPAFAGGFVLEPKKGLYDKPILLLDFNSLYPSIIQEYNICFTTVERPEDGAIAPLPQASSEMAPLPTIIRSLVQRRRQVKSMLKGERDPVTRQQLDVRQLALKLTANSMYGCLGFQGGRFYAKPLAELVTAQGREILQATKDLVESQCGLEVVYGDTDSIMVYTAAADAAEATRIGNEIKKLVNKRYKLLELDLDGIFKRMLLLKKKKYAALKIVGRAPDGSDICEREEKGLDIVRRDWCPLSKDCGRACLDHIFSDASKEDVVAQIHEHLREVAAAMREGKVPTHKFIITKQLTKRIEDYPDARTQAHVQVAIRRRAAGKRDGVAQGETVPYVICVDAGESAEGDSGDTPAKESAPAKSSGSKGLAERAYHPEEIKASAGRLTPDVAWYLSQQVHPVVARLCAHIEGTDAAQIAECLGMDAARFKGAAGAGRGNADDLRMAGTLDEDEWYVNCDPLLVKGADGQAFRFLGVEEALAGRVAPADLLRPRTDTATTPATAATLANQAELQVRAHVRRYYRGTLSGEADELQASRTRDISLRVEGDAQPGTLPRHPRVRGSMHAVYSEAALYLQLAHYARLLDPVEAVRRMESQGKMRKAAEVAEKAAAARGEKLAVPYVSGMGQKPAEARRFAQAVLGGEVCGALERAAGVVRGHLHRCAYKFVDLEEFFGELAVAPRRRRGRGA